MLNGQCLTFLGLVFLWCLFGHDSFAAVKDGTTGTACPTVRVEVERLPDLHVPRSGHSTFCVNGEVVVVGGHTTGFIPTATAEYYSDGEWHLLQTVYAHDDGLCVALKSGKVLIGGGHEKHLGIGQTFTVEMYDPITHTFDGFGCLDIKRAMASGLELDSGKVMIVGNWYHDDAIEMFDGKKHFTYIKGVTNSAPWPHVFRTASNNALILPVLDAHGNYLKSNVVDQLDGDTLHIPLLETWHPLENYHPPIHDDFIGNEAMGDYSYLVPVQNDDNQIAIALVRNGQFSLLPTACPVPMESPWEPISYCSPIVVDQQTKRAYMMGVGQKPRGSMKYVLCIDYGKKGAAPLTLYYTDELPGYEFGILVNSEGNMVLSGGSMYDNFKPSAASYLLLFGTHPSSFIPHISSLIPWIVVTIAILMLVSFLYLRHENRRKRRADTHSIPPIEPMPKQADNTTYDILTENVCKLMEERQLFLNSDLKVSDVAAELGTNSRYVSDCIKAGKDATFKQFVNGYRVEYAKRLMRQHPDMKLSVVGLQSGFSNEMTFFRTFKAFTGMTPREWVARTG